MSETERILSINAIDELEDEDEGQGMTQFPPTPGCPGTYDDEVDRRLFSSPPPSSLTPSTDA
jgi:hypothetical protein